MRPNLDQIEPLDVTVPIAARLLGCGEATIYRLIDAGELETYKIGRRRQVTLASVNAFRARQIKAEKDRV